MTPRAVIGAAALAAAGWAAGRAQTVLTTRAARSAIADRTSLLEANLRAQQDLQSAGWRENLSEQRCRNLMDNLDLTARMLTFATEGWDADRLGRLQNIALWDQSLHEPGLVG